MQIFVIHTDEKLKSYTVKSRQYQGDNILLLLILKFILK